MGRQHHLGRQAEAHHTPSENPLCCALCGRAIPPQARSSLHHLTPKLKGGAQLGTVRLHQICHSAIHARYTEAEIARHLAAPAALRDDPELARFVAWVRTKPDDFHAPTRRTRGRTAKWKKPSPQPVIQITDDSRPPAPCLAPHHPGAGP